MIFAQPPKGTSDTISRSKSLWSFRSLRSLKDRLSLFSIPTFKKRSHLTELMDAPDANREALLRTVDQFTLINRLFSRSRTMLKRYVLAGQKGSFTMLDVGCGGGDIMRWLVQTCRKADLGVQVVCLDRDPRIVEFAQTRCHAFPEISIREGDVRELSLDREFDYVFCNNFLHHFRDPEIPEILSVMYRAATRALLISDIARSRSAYAGYGLFSTLFLHQSFAGYDGRLSIQKGFLQEDLVGFARKAGIWDASRVEAMWPARLLLCVKRPLAMKPRDA